MPIEIVDLPIKDGDFPVSYVSLLEGSTHNLYGNTPAITYMVLSARLNPFNIF